MSGGARPSEFNSLDLNPFFGDQGFAAWKTIHQEAVDYLNRRAQACVKWPADLARCQSPQELVQEHFRFVSQMVSDWQASTERVAIAFSPSRLDGDATRAA